MLCSLFLARFQISLDVLYHSVSEWRPVAVVQREGAQNMDCQQYWTLINLPTSSCASTSLRHQLIQAWSDTWASGVSAAIKMPPLEHFNWNFCCWCVNSCRTEKGGSIIPVLHRLPEVKWQQLLWHPLLAKATVYLWFYYCTHLCTTPLPHLHAHVWVRKIMETEAERKRENLEEHEDILVR